MDTGATVTPDFGSRGFTTPLFIAITVISFAMLVELAPEPALLIVLASLENIPCFCL